MDVLDKSNLAGVSNAIVADTLKEKALIFIEHGAGPADAGICVETAAIYQRRVPTSHGWVYGAFRTKNKQQNKSSFDGNDTFELESVCS